VEVVDRTEPGDRIAGIGVEQLRGWVSQQLAGSRFVTVGGEAQAGAYVLRLELGVATREDEDTGKRARVVLASARAAPVGGGPEAMDLQASGVGHLALQPGSSDAPALRRVVDSLTQDLLFQAELAVGPPDKLVRALTAQQQETSRLIAAEDLAAARQLKEAVPALIQLLRHKDESVADRAIGSLVAIGDRRAVKPLTQLSEFRDTARMAKVLDAIGALGGEEARDYLEFVSTGHEDADIRNLASEALERMKRGTKPAAEDARK